MSNDYGTLPIDIYYQIPDNVERIRWTINSGLFSCPSKELPPLDVAVRDLQIQVYATVRVLVIFKESE